MTPEMEKNLGDLNALVKRVTVVDWDTTTRMHAVGSAPEQQIEK